MPTADVVVVGAGLSGLSAALAAAESGARVQVLAKGHAGTHWGSGGFDVAVAAGATTPRDGLEALAARPGHPYAHLASGVEPALEWIQTILAAEGLVYEGTLDTRLQAAPTSIGGTRPVAILPTAQAAGARPWATGERLVVCGIAGFKDFWPEAIAAGLSRPDVWGGSPRPERVDAVTVDLPGLAARHNLNAVELARRFDDPVWRAAAIDKIASVVGAARGGVGTGAGAAPGAGATAGAATAGAGAASGAGAGFGRVALPAVLGLNDHAAVFDELRRHLPLEPFELPLVPPSVPGMRLYFALRAALIRLGGRVRIGEGIASVERVGGRVTAVATEAAARTSTVRTGALIIATGGIAGGGIVADSAGHLHETVLGLPVEAPEVEAWLARDAFDRSGHPLESAGIRTDADLRPVDFSGAPIYENVRIVGSMLAGQRSLHEGCRDGVAIAGGWRVGRALAANVAAAPGPEPASAPGSARR